MLIIASLAKAIAFWAGSNQSMPTAQWIIKLNFLILALGIVLYAMFVLRHRGLNPNVLSAVGISVHESHSLSKPRH